MLPSGRTYELEFRPDIRPHKCQVPSCSRRAEIVPKNQRSQAWRLPVRSPDDPIMGQAEWELWSTEGFRSYCTGHKCDVMGCDHGLKFDENGQVYNLCRYHCGVYGKDNEGSEGKKKSSVTKIVGKIFSTGTPKPTVKILEDLSKKGTWQGEGEPAIAPYMCDARNCERLQIVDAQGNGGKCEVHTLFPVLRDSGSAEVIGTYSVPPIAILYDVNITGRSRGGGGVGPPSMGSGAVAGSFVIVNGVVSALLVGLGG